MPAAATASSSTFEPASVPHVRIVLTPIACSRAACWPNSPAGGPHVMPLTSHGCPLTSSDQLPFVPATRTLPSAGPVGVGSGVGSGVGFVVGDPLANARTSHSE